MILRYNSNRDDKSYVTNCRSFFFPAWYNGAYNTAQVGIEKHGTQGSVLYSQTGIGEMIARFRSGATRSAGVAGSERDGKLPVPSDNVAGAERQWLVQDLPAARRAAFDQRVAHNRRGTRGSGNIATALDLTAIAEAVTRSALSGQLVLLAELERA